MKALFPLIPLTFIVGCSTLQSTGSSSENSQKTETAEIAAATDNKSTPDNKVSESKPKVLTPIHVDALPPLPGVDSKKTPGTQPTTAKVEPKTTNTSSSSKVEPKSSESDNAEQFVPVKVLKVGSRGEEVRTLKKQLAKLRYDVGKVNSFYDKQTRQAVLAFQKYNDLKRTGTYTLETQQALNEATVAEGFHPELGLPRIEVDLTRQVLLFFDKQGLNRVIAVSTGTNKKYCEKSKKSGRKVCGVASTPTGTFKIQRRVPGWRESDLGKLYNPLYFYDGYAIHGSLSVPAYNASHGCVRVSIATSVWLYDTIQSGTPVVVFD